MPALFFFTLIFNSALVFAEVPKKCIDWNKDLKIERFTPSCYDKCWTTTYEYNDYSCLGHCEEYCFTPEEYAYRNLNHILYVFGLTYDELKLSAQNLEAASDVYFAKNSVQSMVTNNFRVDLPDSESDAFRHITWAAITADEIGIELSSKFLNAHESGLPDNDPGKLMDLKNNKLGHEIYAKLKKDKKLNEENIEKEAIKAIKSNKATVLKPREGIWKKK
ncbi:MAG: hypothetical protein V4596_02695 [Bdellovibrionota bacterium]